MKNISLASAVLALSLTLLSACGGSISALQPSFHKTKAVIKIETRGPLDQGTMIGGITVTGVLPAGVTVKATPDPQNPNVLITDSDVVIASGVTGTNAATFATYNAADRKVTVQVYDQDGFGVGEFVTVTCDIASGAKPTESNFGLNGFMPKDLNGALISNLTPTFTVAIH